jgi:hypothetical protein
MYPFLDDINEFLHSLRALLEGNSDELRNSLKEAVRFIIWNRSTSVILMLWVKWSEVEVE